jgi:hypothetical protein
MASRVEPTFRPDSVDRYYNLDRCGCGLLVYSLDHDDKKFSALIAFGGLWLSWITIYFTASFREFRRELCAGLPDGPEKSFLRNEHKKRLLRQWPVFFTTFALLTAAWLWQFWTHGWHWTSLVLGTLSLAVFGIAAKQGTAT